MPLDPELIQAITSFITVAGPFIGFSARPLYDRWMVRTEAIKVRTLADANADAKRIDATAEADAEQIKALKRRETERLLSAQDEVHSTEIVSPPSLLLPPPLATIEERAEFREKNRRIAQQYNLEDTFVRALPHIGVSGIKENPPAEWLIVWSDGAAEQGRDEARETWAKVLAGELASPGSVSTATLEVLRYLSYSDAQLFARVVGLGNKFGTILLPGELSAFPFLSFDEVMRLASARLMHIDDGIRIQPMSTVGQDPAFLFRGFAAVVDKSLKSIPARWMTTAGIELLPIVNTPPLPEYIQFLAMHLPIRCFYRMLREEAGTIYYGPSLTVDALIESLSIGSTTGATQNSGRGGNDLGRLDSAG